MATNREVISDIVNSLKALNSDDRKSNRYLLSQMRDKVSVLIKQDTDSRRLFSVGEFWGRIRCMNMEEVDVVSCCGEIPHCKTVMKSKKKIPHAFLSSYGVVMKVLTINAETEYKQTTLAKYKDIMNREFVNPNVKYFWVQDGYLYIPNSHVKTVQILGLFIDTLEVEKLNSDEDASGNSIDCFSPLDSQFPAPDYIITIAKQQIIAEYAGVTARLVEDERSDMSSNVKQ